MSVQVKHRRDTAANLAAFTPAQGEIVVDTTNNRMIVGDGSTVGGWPAAKLTEVPSIVVQNSYGGSLNRFRNGTMDIWQRGTSITATTAGNYTADGWIVTPTGANVAVTQAGGLRNTKTSLQITGATSVTDVQISQRIESYIATNFCSQQVTVQALVNNTTGTSITPTLTVKRPSTGQDAWGSTIVTDVSAVSLQSCANGATTQIAYTFTANSGSYNGLQIIFDFGNNFSSSSQSIRISELDIRVQPGAATGINSSPPPAEFKHIWENILFCQRYFTILTQGILVPFSTTTGTAIVSNLNLRATPSVLATAALQIVKPGTGTYTQSAANVSLAGLGDGPNGISLNLGNFTGLIAGQFCFFNFTSGQKIYLSAEL